MKIIINVKPSHKFSQFNRLTFPVKNINNELITVEIEPNIDINLTLKEIIIVEIIEEYQHAYEVKSLYPEINKWIDITAAQLHDILQTYTKIHNIYIPPFSISTN